MNSDLQDVATEIVARGVALGASGVGIAAQPATTNDGGAAAAAWPEAAAALVVLTLAHPEAEPDLDYWGVAGGTVGNRRMKLMLDGLAGWLRVEHGLVARALPYQIEQGGAFLKEAAAMAGLGVIGANNLLVTPEHGPRVRLRALAVTTRLPPTEPTDWSPCGGCPSPCLAACPQDAFATGTYDRGRCQRQMARDEAARSVRSCDGMPQSVIDYCRACELACVV